MNFWQYQSAFRWSDTNGILSDQARLWINALFKTVTTEGEGPVQLGGDIGGTSASPIVIGWQTRPISAAVPTNGQVMTWVSVDGMWEPKTATAPTVPVAVRETPSGTLNGTNKVFALSFAPNPAASLTLYLNGVEQVPAIDYVIASSTITYTVAPKNTDFMIAQYTH